MADIRRKPPTKTREHEAEQAVLDKCCSEIAEVIKVNDWRKPCRMVAEIAKDLKSPYLGYQGIQLILPTENV